MRVVKSKVWTRRRKWMGNLIPALFYTPILGGSVWWMVVHAEILGTGMWLACAALVVGWLALNQFGLFENGRMKRELERELRADNVDLSGEKVFVGFASPKYASVLDAHEDIGFLLIEPDALEFVGEHRRLRVARVELSSVRFRPNVHSLVGLGRWVSVDGRSMGQPIRLLVEPREAGTMLANRRDGKVLRARLTRWLKTANPGVEPGAA